MPSGCVRCAQAGAPAAMAVLADELLAREPAQRAQRPAPDAQQGADRPRLRAVGSLRDEEVA